MTLRVLLTNDDGGPNDLASPYVKYLVEAIETLTNWELTICVPSSQKSWIGKAHFAGRDVKATYIYSSIKNPDDNSYHGPFAYPQPELQQDKSLKEWCLIDGTPATCTDIGLNHISSGADNIDLVLSGPNVGRNSSSLYSLSSGTIGGAMEGTSHGKKAIAVSYAYYKSFKERPEILREASLIAIKIIEKLYNSWNTKTDVYSINIPLKSNLKLGETKVLMVPFFENKWAKSLFQATSSQVPENEKGYDIVDQSVTSGQIFKWSPDFEAVHKNVAKSTALTDGKAIERGEISVTAMKAIFTQVDEINQGELILDLPIDKLSIEDSEQSMKKQYSSIVISLPKESYIFEPLEEAASKYLAQSRIYSSLEEVREGKFVHISEYEDLDHERLMTDSKRYFTNSYIYRKSLIRKNYLANTVKSFTSKNPGSILKKSFPKSFNLELDYAEFLDDALDEIYEFKCELLENEQNPKHEQKTYILKPSMSDKGQGIRIFKTIDQLQEIFDSFEENDSDEEYPEDCDDDNGIITSQLRDFVIQDYIDDPLLLSEYGDRKFHIRCYVLCSNNLKVYVYKRMLMLFSEFKYEDPNSGTDVFDMKGHLTNTCLQRDKKTVIEINNSVLNNEQKNKIETQIFETVGDLFKAGLNVDRINFQPLPNAFEIFGLDFLVNSKLDVSLLEVNSFPDFKQTGDDLKGLIYELFEGVMVKSIKPFLENTSKEEEFENLYRVLNIDNNY